jgi:hypothetical protein
VQEISMKKLIVAGSALVLLILVGSLTLQGNTPQEQSCPYIETRSNEQSGCPATPGTMGTDAPEKQGSCTRDKVLKEV